MMEKTKLKGVCINQSDVPVVRRKPWERLFTLTAVATTRLERTGYGFTGNGKMNRNKNLLCNAAQQRYAGANKNGNKISTAAHRITTGSFAEILKDAGTTITQLI